MIPQLILIVLWSLNLGLMINDHGKPKTGNQNAWVTVVAIIVTGTILYFGGFFNPLFK
jgi:LPXTG-motif cell wall-anchored protein